MAVAFLAVLVLWIWGLRKLDGLPDVGDPFDVAEARKSVVIADADNAYVLYAQIQPKPFPLAAPLSSVDYAVLTWSKAGTHVRDFMAEDRPALELWREGSERPDALYHQPGQIAVDTILPVISGRAVSFATRGFGGIAARGKGRDGKSLDLVPRVLRSSRLVGRHGVIIERMVGASSHRDAAKRIVHWAADPRVDAGLLRKALDDTLAADAMTPPLSEALKLDYLMYLRDMEELRVIVGDIPMPGGRFGWLEQMVAATGAKSQIQRIRLRAYQRRRAE